MYASKDKLVKDSAAPARNEYPPSNAAVVQSFGCRRTTRACSYLAVQPLSPRAAVEAVVVPAAKIDVLAHWGGLVEDGVHASKEDLMKVLYGAGATRQKSGRACERSAHLAIG